MGNPGFSQGHHAVSGEIYEMPRAFFAALFIAFALLFVNMPCRSEILFDEVSEQMGLGWPETWITGQSPYKVYNLGWPDFNTDGFPDLWLASHGYYGAPPQLWINQGGKGFTNIVTKRPIVADVHCGSWGDFDNDGDPDLYFHAGAMSGLSTLPQKRVFYVNENLRLVDRATEFGLNPGFGSGRSALWFDYNKDGRLDLAQFNETLNLNVIHPSTLLAWKGTSFIDVSQETGIELNPNHINKVDSAHFGIISDLFDDGVPDFMMLDGAINKPSFITRIYRNEGALLQDITNQFPPINGNDAVVADFNGDTVPDIFVVDGTGITESMIFYPTNSGYLVSRLSPSKGQMHGVSFKTSGDIGIQCANCLLPVMIGSQTVSPASLSFTLSAADPFTHGQAALTIPGTYIGYDAAAGSWSIRMLAPPTARRVSKDIHVISSTKSFSALRAINFTNLTEPRNSVGARLPIYLEYDPVLRQYVNRASSAGFTKMMGYGVVAGDFDNDMDEDLYIRQGTLFTPTLAGLPFQSVYLENQGNGTFKEALDLKGAVLLQRGPGSAVNDYSRVPSVVADYNLDGFLDIYTSVGEHRMMDNRFYAGLPPRLFRNRGNKNHWIQIDLQGTVSNRDAIGAKVLVYTPDGKVQMRMQDGGNHFCAQDQHRLHFGLGLNTAISSIEVKWPTGKIQVVNNAVEDQVIRVVEQPN